MSSDQEDTTNGTSNSTTIASNSTNEAPTPVVGYEEAQFTGAPGSGIVPNGNVLVDSSNGDIFGTTQGGGTGNIGTIFESPVPPGGGQNSTPVTLTSFSNYTAPAGASLSPGPLAMDAQGDLFGTTETGGTTKGTYGTIFELDKTSTGYAANPTPIVSFKPRFGTGPEDLTMVGQDLFGVTASGRGGGGKGGTVFEVAPTRHGTYPANPHVLTGFQGAERISSNLLVTSSGVIGAVSGGKAGAGEIFELRKRANGAFARKPTVLEKGVSAQNLATDSSGDVFAVSSNGGADHEGAVYELAKTSKGFGGPTDLLDFNGSNGADPTGITLDSSGNIYGTTHTGGTYGYGTLFGIAKTSTGYEGTNTVPFSGQNTVIGADSIVGANPVGSPTLSGNVFLYGTTQAGGSANAGTLYGLVSTGDFSPTFAGGSAAGSSSDALASDAVVENAIAAPAAAVCFAGGTRIRTTKGEVAVEALAVGDRVVTASGAVRPIKWLGHRTTDCRRHPHPHEVMPIRIAAHAFAPSKPSRDLYVSPGHAVCVDVMGEVLVPAGVLVNGTTITQVDVERVTYWHVELDAHDIVLAEGVPAESYLEMGNRRFFAEDGVVQLAAAPDAAPGRTHADFCRPYHWRGPRVDAVRSALAARGTVEEQRLAS